VEIRQWTDLWLGRTQTRDRPAVVLVLLDDAFEQDDPAKPAHPFLEEIAMNENVAVLFQSNDRAGDSGIVELARPQFESGLHQEIQPPQACGTGDAETECATPHITGHA
jgi:hypothetical protein